MLCWKQRLSSCFCTSVYPNRYRFKINPKWITKEIICLSMNLYTKRKEIFVNIVRNLHNRARILAILFAKKRHIPKCKLKEEFREWTTIHSRLNMASKIRRPLRESSSVNFVTMDCLLNIFELYLKYFNMYPRCEKMKMLWIMLWFKYTIFNYTRFHFCWIYTDSISRVKQQQTLLVWQACKLYK